MFYGVTNFLCFSSDAKPFSTPFSSGLSSTASFACTLPSSSMMSRLSSCTDPGWSRRHQKIWCHRRQISIHRKKILDFRPTSGVRNERRQDGLVGGHIWRGSSKRPRLCPPQVWWWLAVWLPRYLGPTEGANLSRPRESHKSSTSSSHSIARAQCSGDIQSTTDSRAFLAQRGSSEF